MAVFKYQLTKILKLSAFMSSCEPDLEHSFQWRLYWIAQISVFSRTSAEYMSQTRSVYHGACLGGSVG